MLELQTIQHSNYQTKTVKHSNNSYKPTGLRQLIHFYTICRGAEAPFALLCQDYLLGCRAGHRGHSRDTDASMAEY